MVRCLAVLAVVAAVGSAGCAFDGCGLSPDSAVWEDPALHAGLPDGGEHHGAPVAWSAPPPGMPLADADLDARWGRWSLAGVSWGSDQGGFNYYPLTASPGAILGVYPDHASFQARRGDVATFLAGFGVEAARALQVAEAMAGNATPSQVWGPSGAPYLEFRAAIPSGWGPQPAWDSYCCIAEADSAIGGLGQAQLLRGQWAFLFLVETKHLAGEGFTLDTDAEGRAEFRGFPMGDGETDRYRRKVLEELGGLNLPQPGRDSLHLNGSIC